MQLCYRIYAAATTLFSTSMNVTADIKSWKNHNHIPGILFKFGRKNGGKAQK